MRKTSGHKRGVSDAADMYAGGRVSIESSPDHFYRNVRQSLRPLPQAPTSSPPITKRRTSHLRTQTLDQYPELENHDPFVENPQKLTSPISPLPHSRESSPYPSHATFVAPDISELKKSSTGYLRTLSKFAQSTEAEDLALVRPGASVVGLQNRRQLKRTDSVAGKNKNVATRSFGFERNWMDKQRQFLQAYEYLCHIGEAKEWIEDIIHQQIPPVVQLEQALRDGVTLAEIVQAFHPDQRLRIFRHERLQYKHSDNIVMFFRFLEEVGLPELFRFELIDLYEKKNIPKVIYCIHALSWLLYRKGMVDFRIGNLVGQLQFEHHELEQTQKGLDKSGVSMPSFQGMGASFGAEPEPEPEPVETEQERIDRELEENEATIIDFQNQIRGAMVRLKLGDTMSDLWESENRIIQLQSIIRGDWARQVINYKLDMKQFATRLQAASRGFLVRRADAKREQHWKASEQQVLKLQSLVRARKSRAETKKLRTDVRKHDMGIKSLQAAIRGALTRRDAEDQIEAVRETGKDIKIFQAAIRGLLERKSLEKQQTQLQSQEKSILLLQASARGLLQRSRQARMQQSLESLKGRWTELQSSIRGMQTRNGIFALKEELRSHSTLR